MELTYKNVKDFLEKISEQEYTDEQKKSPLDWDGAKALYKAFVLEHLEASLYDYSPKSYAIDLYSFDGVNHRRNGRKLFIAKSMIEKMGFEEYTFEFWTKGLCGRLHTVAMEVKGYHNKYRRCVVTQEPTKDYAKWELDIKAYEIYLMLCSEVIEVKEIKLELPPKDLGFDIEERVFYYKGDYITRRKRRWIDMEGFIF